MRRAQTQVSRRGRVGLGGGWWERVRTGGNKRGLQARMHGTGRGLFVHPRLRRIRVGRKRKLMGTGG
jgi:hypothetical protein